MKQIEAVIHQHKLHEVRNALGEMGIEEFMESVVKCHTNHGHTLSFRGAKFVANTVEKVKLEIIAADESAAKIIEAIGSIARTGRREDCRIAVRPYLEVI
jgi:nitrogen regulatory protein PII